MKLENAVFLNAEGSLEKGGFRIVNGNITFQPGAQGEEVMDCEEYIIVPGLMNAHFHSYSPLAAGLMKEMAIQDWAGDSDQGRIQQLFFDYLDHHMSREFFYKVAQKSYIEMVKGGVTFVSDSDPGPSPWQLSEAVNDLGIRGIVDTYEEIGEYHNKMNGRVMFGTHLLEEEDLSEEELRKLQDEKEAYKAVRMTHCMENKWRHDLVYEAFGRSSVELYQERGLLDKETVLFHGVYLSEKDIGMIADQESSVVHCPLSNLDTGAGVADVPLMLEKGVNVSLGTDFVHTNMWHLMRMVYYGLKIHQPVERFSAADVWKMATVNGAAAYGLQDRLGRIEEGCEADLVFIKKNEYTGAPFEDEGFSTALNNLMFQTREADVHHVMVAGDWVMKDSRMTKVDEQEINEAFSKALKGFQEYVNERRDG
ncbi:amidohydrolase family protein [Halobacillus litoralis]|uniref:Amidohydrolase family protein n=1 Tax=Halobacillus litoralis TaxID=45668 RepID=A0A845DMQ7_9BACI|nr:amidohydrolase family protein [Halobacillus litoralis]MYL18643.1 amidohydrolase family protein [Halobacillus litoralis]